MGYPLCKTRKFPRKFGDFSKYRIKIRPVGKRLLKTDLNGGSAWELLWFARSARHVLQAVFPGFQSLMLVALLSDS